MMFLSGVVPPTSRKELPQTPLPAVEVKSKAVGTPPVVVLVVEVVVEVEVVEELEVVDELEVELVVGRIVDVVVLEDELVVVGSTVDEVVVLVGTVEELVVVAGTVEELVVVGSRQVQTSEQVEPGGQVKAPPGELGSQGSPGSTTPLPQSGDVVVVVLVLVELVVGASVDDVVVVSITVVELEVVVGVMQVHSAEQVEPGGQVKAPPGELGSQGSPGSTMPLPHSGEVVVVVLVLELVELLVVGTGLDVVEVDVVVELDVVVAGGRQVSWMSVTLSVLTELAKNRPRSVAPTVSSSLPFGAQTRPSTDALRDTRTLLPLEKIRTSQGLTAGLSGPTRLPLSNLIAPTTWMVTGPRARSCPLRRTVRLQNV
jgi:hypothetical protein